MNYAPMHPWYPSPGRTGFAPILALLRLQRLFEPLVLAIAGRNLSDMDRLLLARTGDRVGMALAGPHGFIQCLEEHHRKERMR
jgi:hypothetical protein